MEGGVEGVEGGVEFVEGGEGGEGGVAIFLSDLSPFIGADMASITLRGDV